MNYILLAEDDDTLRTGLALALESEGYEICACEDGAKALAAYTKRRPDLMLLDIMMPGKSGYDVCVEVRRHDRTTPIIFLTAKSSEEDIVLGLGLGADDFIAKPLRIRELLARVAAALRRSADPDDAKPRAHPGNDVLASQRGGAFSIGSAIVDERRYLVTTPGNVAQPLTIRELGLLKMFAAHPGEVLARAELLDSVWGMDYGGGTRTLDQHIVQIRRKLGDDGARIETIRGVGYRLS